MTDFKIGDESYADEINTAYDQDQLIGDTPSQYNAAGAEPIDAKNGSGFMDVGKLGEGIGTVDHSNSVNPLWICPECGKKIPLNTDDYNAGRDAAVHLEWEHMEKYPSVMPYEISTESLNKDGSGVPRAVRGLDPTKTSRKWLRFVYVSKSDCALCKEFDGKVYRIDDENRPCIPRLEEWDGFHPVTHPNCKCKWVRTFHEEDFGHESDQNIFNAVERMDNVDKGVINRARKENEDFDQLTDADKKWRIIQMLVKDLSKENKISGNESEPSQYGIQSMLDKIVERSLGRQGAQEIKEAVEDGFSLQTIMELVSTKLASKLGKRLGVEGIATEGGKGSGVRGHVPWMLGAEANDDCPNCMISTERENGKCVLCGN